jgi:hypothetical protein
MKPVTHWQQPPPLHLRSVPSLVKQAATMKKQPSLLAPRSQNFARKRILSSYASIAVVSDTMAVSVLLPTPPEREAWLSKNCFPLCYILLILFLIEAQVWDCYLSVLASPPFAIIYVCPVTSSSSKLITEESGKKRFGDWNRKGLENNQLFY